MKTEIINDSEPSAAAPVECPALWRCKTTGSVWLQASEKTAVVIHSNVSPRFGHKAHENHAGNWPAMFFTRLTTPITIKFTP